MPRLQRVTVRPGNAFIGHSIEHGQPIEAFLEPAREIVVPALAGQPPLVPDLLHRKAMHQDVMDDRRPVRAEFALGPVQPDHRLSLTFGHELAALRAVDMITRGVNGLRSPLRPLPIVLEGASRPILRFVQLLVRVQAAERIVADRSERNDFLAWLARKRIVDLDRDHLRIPGQVKRATVVALRDANRLAAFRTRHIPSPSCWLKSCLVSCTCDHAAATSRSTKGPVGRSAVTSGLRVR